LRLREYFFQRLGLAGHNSFPVRDFVLFVSFVVTCSIFEGGKKPPRTTNPMGRWSIPGKAFGPALERGETTKDAKSTKFPGNWLA
jgi:hypothetical protein